MTLKMINSKLIRKRDKTSLLLMKLMMILTTLKYLMV